MPSSSSRSALELISCLPDEDGCAIFAHLPTPIKEVRVGQVGISRRAIAPGLTAGRGLKPLEKRAAHPDQRDCARPNRRARIETPEGRQKQSAASSLKTNCARPNRRARIETTIPSAISWKQTNCARPNRRARIETCRRSPTSSTTTHCARPNRRARIETVVG